MIKLFSQNGIIYRFFNWFSLIMISNACFILTSLPIFTIGASTTALYSVLFKIRAGEEPFVFRAFLKAFKENFKQSTIIWILILSLSFWFGLCIYLFSNSSDRIFSTYTVLMILLLIVVVLFTLYVFPVLSQFDNQTVKIIQNSFVLMFRHLLTTFTIVMLLCTILLLMFYNAFTLAWSIGFLLSFGFALIHYICSAYLEKIFDRYLVENLTSDNLDKKSL